MNLDFKKLIEPYGSLTGKGPEKKVTEKTVEPVIKKEVIKSQIKKIELVKKKEKEEYSIFRTLIFLKLLNVVNKNIQLLKRSKTSSLIILLGPLLIVLLVGLGFNTSSLYDLKIAAYSESYSDLTNSLIDNLKDQQYSTIKVESEEKCVDGVKLGNYHICAIFPKDMQVANDADNVIKFFVDKSRMNLAYIVANTIFSKVASKSTELSLDLTTDLVSTIDSTNSIVTAEFITVEDLKDSNSQTKSKITGVKDSFATLDFEINESELNLTKVQDELKTIKEKLNISASALRYVDEALEDLTLGVTTLKEKMSDAQLARDAAVNDLDVVRDSLNTDLKNVNKLKSSMDTITANIAGLTVTNAETIVDPVKTEVEPITQKTTHLSTLFPTMLVLLVMFVSLLLSSTVIIREKLSKAFFRNFITPTHDLIFMIGHYLTNASVVGFQLAIIFAVSFYFFKGDLLAIFGNLVLVLFITATIFILMGMIIGYIFNSEETSTLAAISTGSLMLFFSNTILPIETLPDYIRIIANYNPFVLSESILKRIMLFDVHLSAVSVSLYMLLCFIAIFFVLSFVAREVTKRKFD